MESAERRGSSAAGPIGFAALVEAVSARLESARIHSARRESQWLVEAVTGLDRVAGVGATIPAEQARAVHALAVRRCDGEPLQYLTGVAGFRALELAVGPGVLIPRPETEEVAGRAVELLPRGGTVVDVGTGSGAIALAIKDERPDARVIATDVSPQAIEWAKRNRRSLGLDVGMAVCDLVASLQAGSADVIVSNPPYVADAEEASLPRDVVDHEPRVALFAGGDGLAVIGPLAAGALRVLRPGAWLVIEIAPDQADAVARMLARLGYEDIEVHPDATERQRCATARRP